MQCDCTGGGSLWDTEYYLFLQELLSATAVLKLNGGLGTSMGLEKAKSLLIVKDNKTFLDLIAEQIKYTRKKFDSNVRFVLMNSFSTSDDTKEHLSKAHKDLIGEEDVELLQNKSPKVDAKTLEPASWPQDPDLEWSVLIMACLLIQLCLLHASCVQRVGTNSLVASMVLIKIM